MFNPGNPILRTLLNRQITNCAIKNGTSKSWLKKVNMQLNKLGHRMKLKKIKNKEIKNHI